MKTEQKYLNRFINLFIPLDRVEKTEIREVLPFFALISLAWVWMYIVYIRAITSPQNAVIFTVLMVVHLGLYWAVFRFIKRYTAYE